MKGTCVFMKVSHIKSKNIIVKSNLPDADYVINSYVGCTHKCIYCYAEFMKRFSNHKEVWGDFIDIKEFDQKVIKAKKDSTILLSSVTDPYNHCESKYKKTREVLEMLSYSEANIEILTKSDMVIRDLDLLKKNSHIKVGISIAFDKENLRNDIEPYAAKISSRIAALKKLSENGIKTYAFISPIFPNLTDYEKIVKEVYKYVDYICFENLNLRGAYKKRVLDYINNQHSDLKEMYNKIYLDNDSSYWEITKRDICEMMKAYAVDYRIYFYHDKLRKNTQRT